jgi:hypothetical protein
MLLSKVCILNLFDLEARVFSDSMQHHYNMCPETSANYQKYYTITVRDYVFRNAFSTALRLKVLCGWVVSRKEVFMCCSLNLKCFTFELNCGMLFFQNSGTSKQQGSSAICKSLDVSVEQHETPNTINSSASSTATSHNSARIQPVPPVLSHTSPSILQFTSSSSDNQIEQELDDGAVLLQRTRNKYTYKKLSELLEPDKKVNIYGVICTIVKVKLILNLVYILCSY